MNLWKSEMEVELGLAQEARERKNEGQARVRARRAAGIAVRAYFARRGIASRQPSAYELLNQLLQLPELPAGARKAAELLVLRVNEEFRLPVDADLIEEARSLARALE